MARAAAYGGSYDFPNVSFDWLGDLPSTLDEGRIRAARQKLGDLTSSDPSSLDKAAARLLSAGDLEGAKTVYGLSTARRSQETAGVAAAAQAKYVEGLPAALQNVNKQLAPGGAPGGPEYTPSFVQPAPGPGAAPVWPGDRPGAQAAPGPVVAQAAPPSPQPPMEGGPVIPVDGIRGNIQLPPNLPPGSMRIGAAEAPPEAPTQVAGPPMVGGQSPVAPAPVPPPAQPGLDLRFGGTPPSPQAPASQSARPVLNPMAEQEAALREVRALEGIIAAAPKGAQNPGVLARYRNALERANIKGARGDYAYAQAQNAMMGEPVKTFDQWEGDKTLLAKRFEEASKSYGTISDAGETARKVDDTLSKLDSLTKNESFISGKGVATRNLVNQYIVGAIGIARTMGIPDNVLPDPKAIPGMSSTDLTQVFQGLSRQLVVQSLGGLGRNISDKDVVYQDSTFPNLQLTPEANKLLIDFHRQIAQQSIGAFNAARMYRNDAESRNTFSQVGLDNAMNKYYKENPPKSVIYNQDGTKTELGKKFDALVEKQRVEQQGGNPFANAVRAVRQYGGALDARVGQMLSGGPVPTGPQAPTEPMTGLPTQAAPVAPAAPAPTATPPATAGPGAAFQRPVPTQLPPGARRVIHQDGTRGIRLQDGRIIPVQ